ncbi:hypothetical protein [Azotobacter armeniacus]
MSVGGTGRKGGGAIAFFYGKNLIKQKGDYNKKGQHAREFIKQRKKSNSEEKVHGGLHISNCTMTVDEAYRKGGEVT